MSEYSSTYCTPSQLYGSGMVALLKNSMDKSIEHQPRILNPGQSEVRFFFPFLIYYRSEPTCTVRVLVPVCSSYGGKHWVRV